MKTIRVSIPILAAALLGFNTISLRAQDANPSCPLGHEPGYGQTLTPEERAEHRAAMQQYAARLREKKASGSITAEEKGWLERFDARGKGVGRGQAGGKGRGACSAQGKQLRLRDGTGPEGACGACPNGNTPQRRQGR